MIAAMEQLRRALAPLHRRISGMMARGVIRLVDDTKQCQEVQVDTLWNQTQDKTERFEQYGFASHPHPGAEGLLVYPGGNRSHSIMIAVSDRRYRLLNQQEGEVALYDDLGQVVRLTRTGIVVESPADITVQATGKLRLAGDTVVIHAGSLLQWDVGGYGKQTFALGADTWRIDTWQAGATMATGNVYNVHPPEIAT